MSIHEKNQDQFQFQNQNQNQEQQQQQQQQQQAPSNVDDHVMYEATNKDDTVHHPNEQLLTHEEGQQEITVNFTEEEVEIMKHLPLEEQDYVIQHPEEKQQILQEFKKQQEEGLLQQHSSKHHRQQRQQGYKEDDLHQEPEEIFYDASHLQKHIQERYEPQHGIMMRGAATTTAMNTSPAHPVPPRRSSSMSVGSTISISTSQSHISHSKTSKGNKSGNKRPTSNDYDLRQRLPNGMSPFEYIHHLESQEKSLKERIERNADREDRHINEMKLENQRIYMELQQKNRVIESLQGVQLHLQNEIVKKNQEYLRMESNFYSHVRQIRATDDDLSTIQNELSQVFNLTSTLCMGLRSKADQVAATKFVLERWSDREGEIRARLFKEGDETLDNGYIGLFMEKYIVEVLLDSLFAPPLMPGLSINGAFQQVEKWFAQRNPEWATRFRQQASALVAKQPDEEESNIEQAKQEIVKSIMDTIGTLCPKAKDDANAEKKVLTLINRAAKLNLAMKGQELLVETKPIKEGEDTFDAQSMKTANKGNEDGTVFLVITPAFAANDPSDTEHGFLVSAKVLCL